ncbi:MAG: hypothetical protein KBE21_04790, partial [Acetoanaerobium sp.]|nr:hypothetical protein [Acetoanaerobium sp.]
MGYVHTYRLAEEIKAIPTEAFTKIQEVVEKYKDILRLEYDNEDKEPLITNEKIRFNGYKDKGYETFYFSAKELYNFCKTNARDYDLPVCIILLTLFQYISDFSISSDGFWISKAEADEFTKTGKVKLYGYWNEALEYMKNEYNIEFDWHLNISQSGGYEYYCMEICRIPEENISDKVVGSNENYLKDKNIEEKEQENIQRNEENHKQKKIKDKKKAKKADYSKEEKAEYFKNQLEDLKNSIEDKIQNFLDNSEELKNFLKFKNKHFRTYSFRNSLLIYNQFPKASYVAGFKKWQELGYTVNKGSKAIKILVPLIKKSEDKQEDSQEIYGFKSVSVFDISQVSPGPNAEPIPGLDLDVLSTENMEYPEDILFNACKTFVEAHCPLHIVNDDSLKDCLGLTNGKEIFLLDTKKPLDMAAVLIHEYAHLHNHFKENRKTLTKDQKETEAEITAMIFASYFNLNHENRFKYLAMYRKNRDLDKCFTTALNTF